MEKRDELQSPPYVCPIYRRDIASFLQRSKVDEWRLTSRESNRALSEFPSMLPRRIYRQLSIHLVLPPSHLLPLRFFVDSYQFQYNGPCNRKDDGYVTNIGEIPGKSFDSVFKFRFCCKELKVGLLVAGSLCLRTNALTGI